MDETSFLEAAGTVLRIRRVGAAGLPLVLLHEMGGTLESWDQVVPALAGDCRVLAQDLRGFGLSEKIRGTVTMADLASDTAAVIRAVFPGEAVWIAGCAVGGGVAFQLALDVPDLVAGVVALAPATGTPEGARPEVLARIDMLEHAGLKAFFPELQDRHFPQRFRKDPAMAVQMHLRRRGCDPTSYAAVWRAMAVCDIADRLAAIACPVVVVAGTADTSRPPETLRRTAAQIPGARFVVIDSGHAMPVITPDAVAAEIRQALGLPDHAI